VSNTSFKLAILLSSEFCGSHGCDIPLRGLFKGKGGGSMTSQTLVSYQNTTQSHNP